MAAGTSCCVSALRGDLMKKYLKAVVSGLCAAALALGCVGCGSSARKVLEYSMSDLASADRAAVEEQIAAGVSAAEAEALYLTDEYFENWYQSLCTKLSAYEG